MGSIDFTFRPLLTWPGPQTKNRRRSPFRIGADQTRWALLHELAQLDARNIVIQAAVTEDDIRNDGMLRATARTRHPGVILAFDSKHGPLSYPCDTYLHLWCNIRAISLAMAALRAVDRYGVTKRGEQYRGWKALPPPSAVDGAMSVTEAIGVLSMYSGTPGGAILSVLDIARKAYRIACMQTHPDRGGSAEAFARVQAAATVLARHKGVEAL